MTRYSEVIKMWFIIGLSIFHASLYVVVDGNLDHKQKVCCPKSFF